jgi:hypothetical protein
MRWLSFPVSVVKRHLSAKEGPNDPIPIAVVRGEQAMARCHRIVRPPNQPAVDPVLRLKIVRQHRAAYSLSCIDPLSPGGHKSTIPWSLHCTRRDMVAGCANPSGEAQFKSLHEGPLLHFGLNHVTRGPAKRSLLARLRWRWLGPCGCSSTTLIQPDLSEVVLVRLHNVDQPALHESFDRIGAAL